MPYRSRPYRARTTPQPLVLVPLAEATNKGGEDRLCPVERQNLHNSTLIEILLKKVWQEKCDSFLGKTVRYGPGDWQNFYNCIRCKSYSKKCDTWSVIPCMGKTVRYGPVDWQNFHNCIRCQFYSEKCDVWSVTPCIGKAQLWFSRLTKPSQLWISINFDKKAQHVKCDPCLGKTRTGMV